MRPNQNATEGALLLSQQFFRGVNNSIKYRVTSETKCHVFSETIWFRNDSRLPVLRKHLSIHQKFNANLKLLNCFLTIYQNVFLKIESQCLLLIKNGTAVVLILTKYGVHLLLALCGFHYWFFLNYVEVWDFPVSWVIRKVVLHELLFWSSQR